MGWIQACHSRPTQEKRTMTLFNRLASLQRNRVRARCRRFAPRIDALEARALLSNLVVTNTDDSGSGSLRQAIADAKGGDTIAFAHSLRGQTITLTSGELDITQSITIDGLGASNLAVSGGGSSEVFNVASGVSVAISGLTITDGASYQGGGISNAGTLALDGDVVTGNQSVGTETTYGGYGGGIYNTGTLTLGNTAVTDNLASGFFAQGGGIDNDMGTVTLHDSSVGDNQATGLNGDASSAGDQAQGGRIMNFGGTVTQVDIPTSNWFFLSGKNTLGVSIG
jgi:hypothetical protein